MGRQGTYPKPTPPQNPKPPAQRPGYPFLPPPTKPGKPLLPLRKPTHLSGR